MGYIGSLHATNNIKAELLALLQGLKLALERKLVPLEINIDSKEIISFINKNHPPYENILCDCRELLRRLGNPPPPPTLHSFRESNQVADALAKEGARLKQANNFFCMEVPPVFVAKKIAADKE